VDAPESLPLHLDDGRTLSVRVRRSSRAKRITLRLGAADGAPVVTLPRRVKLTSAARFLSEHRAWLAERLARQPVAQPFREGGSFPLRGSACMIALDGRRGNAVRFLAADGAWRAEVPDGGDLRARLTAALRGEARRDFAAASSRYAALIGRRPAGLRITDTVSRWGSCSAAGTLSFSWRLVLAPPAILEALAAHEVAHLVEMNHSPRFWTLLDAVEPRHREARRWLRDHGAALHAVGREA